MTDVIDLVRPELRELRGYGAAAPDFERLRLHANESPWDVDLELPCRGLNRYPPVRALALEERLAELYGVAPSAVLVTRGSDDGIDLLVRTLCRAGEDAVLTTPPTFGMYSVAARVQNALQVEVPLRREAGFTLDADAVIAACRTQPVRLIFLCSPNNPTGAAHDPAAVRRICEAVAERAVVVVDEAYAEFTAHPSHTQDLPRFDNLVIVRTLSKAHGLAGARCGVVLATPRLIQVLGAIAPPYAMPSPVISAVLGRLTPAALAETAERVAVLRRLRDALAERLAALPFVRHVWPSDANFLLVDVDDPERVLRACHERGVLLRHFADKAGLEHALRISIGTPEQQAQLLVALEALA